MLGKEVFKDEFDDITKKWKKVDVTSEYCFKEYRDKVVPYLQTIGYWKTDKGMNDKDIALLLGVGGKVWDVIAKLSDVKEYLRKDGKFMEAKMEMEFLEAKRENQHNAKFHDMAFKLYHGNYGDRKDINYNIPNNIELKITGARMEDDEIKKFADSEDVEDATKE